MPPMFGELTPESRSPISVSSPAACRPSCLLVLAAATATLEPISTSLGIATTTGQAALPLRPRPDARKLEPQRRHQLPRPRQPPTPVSAGPSSSSSATSAARGPKSGDMATMGQPGKYTFCFARRADGPFPIDRAAGFRADVSAVTVMGISGTAEILPGDGEGATPRPSSRPSSRR